MLEIDCHLEIVVGQMQACWSFLNCTTVFIHFQALRSFQLQVEVDPKYHPKIIGRKGAVISKIRLDNMVQIQFPERGSANESLISVTGYERNAEAARDDILKIVHELVRMHPLIPNNAIFYGVLKDFMGLQEDMISLEVSIDNRVHSRLIGSRGRTIRKIMDQYKVDIRFPRDNDPNPDAVVVTGSEENVADAKEHLLNLEEEFVSCFRMFQRLTIDYLRILLITII